MRILLVLAGDPPDFDLIKTEMLIADLVIAVDGGAQSFFVNKLKPDFVIGDLDSYNDLFDDSVKIIPTDDQNLTDLQKSLKYVLNIYDPTSLVFLGATGGRTDHLLNNLHICASIDHSVQIIFKSTIQVKKSQISETLYRISAGQEADLSVTKGASASVLPVIQGATVSVLPVTQFKSLTVEGLLWNINNVDSGSQIVSQSNIAISDKLMVTLASGCVYIAVYQ
mgnify:FL=1